MFYPVDGPAKQGILSVGTGAIIEVKVGASPFADRKVVTIQPEGKIYVYFADDGETPSTTDLTTKGFYQFKDAMQSYEAGPGQKIYVLSATGTVNVRISERS